MVQSIGKKMKKQLGSVDLLVNLCCLQTVRQLSLCLCPVHLRTFHLRFCITIAMLTKYLPKRFKQFPSHFKAIFWIFVFLLCDRAFHSNFHCRNNFSSWQPPKSSPSRWQENTPNSHCHNVVSCQKVEGCPRTSTLNPFDIFRAHNLKHASWQKRNKCLLNILDWSPLCHTGPFSAHSPSWPW